MIMPFFSKNLRMNHFLSKILFLLLVPFFSCFGETVSVIVPCYYKHFLLIPELLKSISAQTQLPHEVVISVSESDKIDINRKTQIEALQYPFKVRYLFHTERLYAGENRNSACENAVGDIFILQDCDDIPHPQRIEILTKLFRQYPDIDHIIHKFSPSKAHNNEMTCPLIFVENIQKYSIKSWYYYIIFLNCHNGNIAIRKEVFEKIHWTNKPRGQDVEFNRKVIEQFHKTMVIDVDLMTYREHLSSLKCEK